MKKLLILCTTLIIIFLSACSQSLSPPDSIQHSDETVISESSLTATEEIQLPTEETTEFCSQLGTEPSVTEEISVTSGSTEPVASVTTDIPSTTKIEDERVEETVLVTEPPKATETIPVETAPSVTEDPVGTETVIPTEPVTVPSEPETIPEAEPEETGPSETEPREPEFDIDYWISYARAYAQGVGLTLNAEAIYCWDNPITAAAHCLYLEQDIQSRLNRYARDKDITDVWIWAEVAGEGRYSLYIGYG